MGGAVAPSVHGHTRKTHRSLPGPSPLPSLTPPLPPSLTGQRHVVRHDLPGVHPQVHILGGG